MNTNLEIQGENIRGSSEEKIRKNVHEKEITKDMIFVSKKSSSDNTIGEKKNQQWKK